MRPRVRIVATIGLAALCVGAAAEGVTQTGDQANFTFTDFETRVPVHLPLSMATGTVGPNFLCHGDPVSVIGASNAPTNSNGRDLDDLKDALFQTVHGKTAVDLGKLLSDVQFAPDRAAKTRLLFGIEHLAAAQLADYIYTLDGTQMRQLEMGQTVRPAMNTSTAAGVGVPPQRQRCYSTQQIDQAIAEGIRVVRLIIRNLDAQGSKK